MTLEVELQATTKRYPNAGSLDCVCLMHSNHGQLIVQALFSAALGVTCAFMFWLVAVRFSRNSTKPHSLIVEVQYTDAKLA